MKTQLIRTLYRLVAFFADKTKGFGLFSKWKLALGSLLIGASVVSVSCRNHQVTCYEPAAPSDNDSANVLCYKPVAPQNNTTVEQIIPPPPPKFVPPIIEAVPEPREPTCYVQTVSCYDVAVVEPPITPIIDTTTIYSYAETMPSFVGGSNALQEYLRQNVPIANADSSISGRIYVRVVINREGNVTEPEILRGSTNNEYNQKIIKLLLQMPKWDPAKQNGQTVLCYYTIPINIKTE